jgi:hypothetical protein
MGFTCALLNVVTNIQFEYMYTEDKSICQTETIRFSRIVKIIMFLLYYVYLLRILRISEHQYILRCQYFYGCVRVVYYYRLRFYYKYERLSAPTACENQLQISP